ncbi:MAG: tetratricopeptide repeat protein, partial [Spirochaetota bacterium]
MMLSPAVRFGALTLLFFHSLGAAVAQDADTPAATEPSRTADSSSLFEVSVDADGWFPRVLDPSSPVSFVAGGAAQLSLLPVPFAEVLARAGAYSIQFDAVDPLFYAGASVGLGLQARLSPRFSIGASGFGGFGRIPDVDPEESGGQSYGVYEVGGRVGIDLRVTPALTLGIGAGYQRLATPAFDFVNALTAGIRLELAPSELSRNRSNLAIEQIETEAVFPVLRSWYDEEPLGSVTIRNNEDGPVENVRVSFHTPEYMGGARLCGVIDRLDEGESAVVPLNAVFDERVLTLTENVKTFAVVSTEYSYFGSTRTAETDFTLQFRHRNAMTWEDDRRAAAFVSPTDPAALWFARYASSVVRDRMRGALPPNLQYALGIFEALNLYGVNYVIDPNSSYIELSENPQAIDYLQYPSQTLMYRGGDCDDLSILFASLLESAGVPTAFITIPGHIYMAFDIGLTEEEAREQFFDPGLLIFRDDGVWAPIEVTMIQEGFVKAWRIGAKQWLDNDAVGSAAIFPMRENWSRYAPTGLPNASARFTLPGEANMMVAFDTAVNRVVTRELAPTIADFEARLARERKPDTLNEYGIALPRAGMLDEAWERFAEAAEAEYDWAWSNLAGVAFIRRDYDLAYSYYEWAASLLPEDPVATLGMARAAYELDRYAESEALYADLRVGAPDLATRFAYLESVYGGSGRAWSMADRLAGMV